MIPIPFIETKSEESKETGLDHNVEQKSRAGQRKKVWAWPLDLEEKISDTELLHYIEELMKLGRIWEAGILGDKLPVNLQQTECIRFLFEERSLIDKRVRDLESLDGWDIQVDGKSRSSQGLSIYYRYKDDCPIIEIKGIFRLEASVSKACCIANEVDLWPTFLSNLLTVETKDCARHGYTTLVPFVKVYLPWPMNHRECYLRARVYDLITEKNIVLFYGEDLGNQKKCLDFKIPDVEGGSIRVKVEMTAMGKPVSWDVTDMICMFTIDPIMKLPQWLMNWLTRSVAWRVMSEFRKACMNLPREHMERKKADKTGLYKYVEDRMEIVFKDLPRTQPRGNKVDEDTTTIISSIV